MSVIQLTWLALALVWIAFEARLAFLTRVKTATHHSDKTIWLVIVATIMAALALKQQHWWVLPIPLPIRQLLALSLFLTGLAVRGYALITLGRFFSTCIVLQQEHELITTGPYRLIRHPAYTGLLCAFAAAGLAMGDGLALLCLCLPITYILIQRINVEEQCLLGYFGNAYQRYQQHTKKLLPWLY